MNQVNFDHWTSLFIVAGIQGLFLSFLLLIHKKGNVVANRILSLLMLCFSLMIGYYIAFWSGYLHVNVNIIAITDPLYLLFGPLLFLYLKIWGNNKLPKNYKLHFIPFVIHVLIYLPFYLQNETGKKAIMLLNRTKGSSIYYLTNTMCFLWMLSLSFYAFLMIKLIKETKNDLPEIGIKWQKLTVIFYIGYVLSCISYFSLLYAGLINVETDYSITFSMTAFIYLVGYLGFRQPELFHGFPVTKSINRYEKSSLSSEKAKELKIEILTIMEHEKLFLQADLKPQILADKLDISIHHLSQVVNDQIGISFPDLLNQYRIAEAKKLLSDNKFNNEKILSIGFDVGYSNKATFNAAFKKYVGMTPSEYKKLNMN